jgi:hypothetical protein
MTAGITSSVTGSLPKRAAGRAAAWFQFSLRELLLGTLVCAAFAAWVYERRERQRPLAPSPIAEYFVQEFQRDVTGARATIGEEGAAWWFAPDAVMDLKGVYKTEHSLSREWFCELNLPSSKASPYFKELMRLVGLHIRQGEVGEHVSTSEWEGSNTCSSNAANSELTKYHCGEVHGTLGVYLTPTGEKTARLVAVLSEHRVP